MTEQDTNYFLNKDFSLDALRHIRLDIGSRRHQFQSNRDFYENQAQMFARLAEAAKSDLEALNKEYKLVDEAIFELRLQEKKVS